MNDNLEYFEKIDKAIEHFSNADDKTLFEFLSSDDEVLQQIALLKLEKISSNSEAEKVTLPLTEHASETREYCSFLINRLMKNEAYRKYFSGSFILDKFAKSISDVNPKVCRKIIEILPFYDELEPNNVIMTGFFVAAAKCAEPLSGVITIFAFSNSIFNCSMFVLPTRFIALMSVVEFIMSLT